MAGTSRMINRDTFIKATQVKPLIATRFYAPVCAAMEYACIIEPWQIAIFLAQICHESGSLVYTRELWGPTPAQIKYEGNRVLGNIYTGDGFKYRGGGLIQITGRSNYASLSRDLDVDFVSHPEYIERAHYSAMSAGWYWKCRNLAKESDFEIVTRAVNGGLNGMADRLNRWHIAKNALALG